MVILTLLVVCLSFLCLAAMVIVFQRQRPVTLSWLETFQLSVSGFIAFLADTLGVGSFAVNIALAKFFNTFHDEELPGVVNGAQVLPGAVASIFFMQLVEVDFKTLCVLVLGTCIGGVLGVRGHAIKSASDPRGHDALFQCVNLIIGRLFAQSYAARGRCYCLKGH